MPSSAELPIFGWEGNRRDFLGGSIRLGAGGLIYAATAPLLAGCSPTDSGETLVASALESAQREIPERHFNTIREGWNIEQKLELTEIVVPHLALLTGNKLTIKGMTMELPFRTDVSPQLAFSPEGNYLAVWMSRRQGSRSQALHRVSIIDLDDFKERPLFERNFDDSTCYLKWARDGRHLLVNISSSGTYLPPRYPYGPMGNLDIYTYVYDAKSKQELDVRGQHGVSISPNGELIVLAIRQNQHYLYNMETKRVVADIDPAHSAFDWSPDSRLLAGVLCSGTTMKRVPVGNRYVDFEECVGEHQLAVFDTSTGEQRYARPIGHPSSLGVRFAPDGKRLLFMDGTTGADKLAVLNLSTGDVERRIEGVKVSSATPFLSLEQNVSFPKKDVLAILGGSVPPYLDFVDLNSGQITREKIVRVAGDGAPVVSRDGFIKDDTLGIWDYSGARGVRGHRHYLYNFVNKTPVFVSDETPEVGKSLALGVSSAKDGDLLLANDQPLLLKDGRKYYMSPGAVELLDERPRSISSSLIESVPRSENKLDFRAGDILVGPGSRAWYLQNGGRYEITGRVEDFVQSRHKNMKAYEVPGWVLDKIQQKELPSRFFEDQYGRLIDGHAERLLFLIAGWGSDSEQVRKDFNKIVKRISFPDEQIVFGTYNFFDGNPGKYESHHSKQFTGLSRDAIRHNIGWLKERAPLAQISVCGHSQGADMAVSAAITHADYISCAIAICGPLKGLDRVFQRTRFTDIDAVGNFLGDAAEFYINAGENPQYAEQAETSAQVLARRNVELYTFSEFFDGLVKPEMAVLQAAKQDISGRRIQQIWRTNITSDPLDAHGILLTHEPFIDLVAEIIGRP